MSQTSKKLISKPADSVGSKGQGSGLTLFLVPALGMRNRKEKPSIFDTTMSLWCLLQIPLTMLCRVPWEGGSE